MASEPPRTDKESTQKIESQTNAEIHCLFTVLLSIIENDLPLLVSSSPNQLMTYFQIDICQLRNQLRKKSLSNKLQIPLIKVREVCSRFSFLFLKLKAKLLEYSGSIQDVGLVLAICDILRQLLEVAIPGVTILCKTEKYLRNEVSKSTAHLNTFEHIFQHSQTELLQSMQESIPHMQSNLQSQFLQNRFDRKIPSELKSILLKMQSQEYTAAHFIQSFLKNPQANISMFKQLVKTELVDPEEKQDICVSVDFQTPQSFKYNFNAVLMRLVQYQGASFQYAEGLDKLQSLIQDTFNTFRIPKAQKEIAVKQQIQTKQAQVLHKEENKLDVKQQRKQGISLLGLSNSSLESQTSESFMDSEIREMESKDSYTSSKKKMNLEWDVQYQEAAWLDWSQRRFEWKEDQLQQKLKLLRSYKSWRMDQALDYDWKLIQLFEYPCLSKTLDDLLMQEAMHEYITQRVQSKTPASLYIETNIFSSTESHTKRNRLYCLQHQQSNPKGPLYFISVGVNQDPNSSDILKIQFNRLCSDAFLIIYFNSQQNNYYYQYQHRLFSSISQKQKDRQKGYYKPTNFLSRIKPSKWTPKAKFFSENSSEQSSQTLTLFKRRKFPKFKLKLVMKRETA